VILLIIILLFVSLGESLKFNFKILNALFKVQYSNFWKYAHSIIPRNLRLNEISYPQGMTVLEIKDLLEFM
jgi:hypothetical protein